MTNFGHCANHAEGEVELAVTFCRHCEMPLCRECKFDEDGCCYRDGEVPWYRWRPEVERVRLEAGSEGGTG